VQHTVELTLPIAVPVVVHIAFISQTLEALCLPKFVLRLLLTVAPQV